MVAKSVASGLGSLLKLLPTGTVFVFQFLSPLLTNDGKACKTKNKYLSGTLLIVSGLACFFSTFTDSYKANGITRYGIATPKGIWPSFGKDEDPKYKLQFGDFVHASFSVLVFAVVALLDTNTRNCFYPSWDNKDLLQALPVVIGAISSAVFAVFPTTRHYIGYPSSSSSSTTSSSSGASGTIPTVLEDLGKLEKAEKVEKK